MRWTVHESFASCSTKGLSENLFSVRELVAQIGRIVEKPRPIVSIQQAIGFLAASLLGTVLKDTLITRDEIEGLIAELLYVNSPPAG